MAELITPFEILDRLTITEFIVNNKNNKIREKFSDYDDAKKHYKKLLKEQKDFVDNTTIECNCKELGLITIHYTFLKKCKNYSFYTK